MTTTTLDIKIEALKESPVNPRTYRTDESIQKLADSLLAVGQIVPIIVTPCSDDGDGVLWEVVDGWTRVLAARKAGWETVRVQTIMDTQPGHEIGLTANMMRNNMTMRDYIVAVGKMSDFEQRDPDEIADLLAITEKRAREVIALANVPKVIFEAFEANDIGLKSLNQYARLEHDEALKLFEELADLGHEDSPWTIQSRINEKRAQIKASSKLIEFVGGERVVREQLGGFQDELFMEDLTAVEPEKIHERARQIMADKAATFKEQGYRDAVICETFQDYNAKTSNWNLKAVSDDDPELVKKLADFVDTLPEDEDEWTEEQREEYDWICHDKDIAFYHDPDRRKDLTIYMHLTDNGTFQISAMKSAPDKKADAEGEKPEKKGTPQSMKDRLFAIKLTAYQYQLERNPHVAQQLLAGYFAGMFAHEIGLSIGSTPFTANISEHASYDGLKPYRGNHDLDEIEDLSKLSAAQCRTIIAAGVAHILSSPTMVSKLGINVAIRKHWTPNEDYFKTLPAHMLVDIFKELGVPKKSFDPTEAKKKDLVKTLTSLFDGTSNLHMTAAQKTKVKTAVDNWLPEELK